MSVSAEAAAPPTDKAAPGKTRGKKTEPKPRVMWIECQQKCTFSTRPLTTEVDEVTGEAITRGHTPRLIEEGQVLRYVGTEIPMHFIEVEEPTGE